MSVTVSANILNSYTLKVSQACQKHNSIITFTLAQLPRLTGRHVNQITLFSVLKQDNGKAQRLQAMLFQVDQKDELGRFVLDAEHKADSVLARQDELVIRTTELGGRLDPDSELLDRSSLIEVKVLSESLDLMGWFYIEINSADSGTVVKPPQKELLRVLRYNKIRDELISPDFKIGFSENSPFLIDDFHWRLDNGQWSNDLSDMMKIRHTGRFLGLPFRRTQADYDSSLTRVKQGPLRVIRRTENHIKVFWKLKTPALFIDYIMTPDGFIMDTMIDIPFKISFFFSELETLTTMDWNPDQLGKLAVYNAKFSQPIVVDGKATVLKQGFNAIEDSRFEVQTFMGNLNVDLDIPDNFPIHAMLYLNDNAEQPDPPETYPGQVGNVGFRTTGWEDIDSQLYHLKFTVCISRQD